MSKMNEKEHDYKFEMGQRLREMRENNVLGQKELAEAVHVGYKQYQRYESVSYTHLTLPTIA